MAELLMLLGIVPSPHGLVQGHEAVLDEVEAKLHLLGGQFGRRRIMDECDA